MERDTMIRANRAPRVYSARADYETPTAAESLRAGMSPGRYQGAIGRDLARVGRVCATQAANSRGAVNGTEIVRVAS